MYCPFLSDVDALHKNVWTEGGSEMLVERAHAEDKHDTIFFPHIPTRFQSRGVFAVRRIEKVASPCITILCSQFPRHPGFIGCTAPSCRMWMPCTKTYGLKEEVRCLWNELMPKISTTRSSSHISPHVSNPEACSQFGASKK